MYEPSELELERERKRIEKEFLSNLDYHDIEEAISNVSSESVWPDDVASCFRDMILDPYDIGDALCFSRVLKVLIAEYYKRKIDEQLDEWAEQYTEESRRKDEEKCLALGRHSNSALRGS